MPVLTDVIKEYLESLDSEALEDVVLALSCKHCEMLPQAHAANLKCLFDATSWEPFTMEEVRKLKGRPVEYKKKWRQVMR